MSSWIRSTMLVSTDDDEGHYCYYYFFHQRGHVLPSICLSVCLSVGNFLEKKTAHQLFVKILPQICLWTRKFDLNFGTRLLLGLDIGIYKDSLTSPDRAFFHNLALCFPIVVVIVIVVVDELD